MTDLTLDVSRTIKAPVDKLFNAWLDPKMLAKFMTPGEGMTVPRATTDPVEGGKFNIIMATPDKELPHHGVYKTITPHSKLVFTWVSAHSIDGSTVTLTFKPVNGGTEVHLHQVKFADEDMRNNHIGGWTAILAQLEKVA